MSKKASRSSESLHRHEKATWSHMFSKRAIYLAKRGGTAGHDALVLGLMSGDGCLF